MGLARHISARKVLEDQGVTCPDAMVAHVNLMYQTLEVNAAFDITTYRVNPRNPNALVPMMG